ncbi:MAG: D-tyrosyl-tRNA(Tyr) deacylase [Clostridia bacterium]|nr:D-tyrosyl-tRNA(Tyr) deacylase [Clostridia bacterium]
MKVVIQRVKKANLWVDGKQVSAIDKGLVVYLGIEKGDINVSAAYLARKIAKLRIFEDDNGKMNHSVVDVGGQVLLVSQFTLLADTDHGHRPSFTQAEEPKLANVLYLNFAEFLKAYGVPVQLGVFGADMTINQCNDGPVTIVMEKK